MAGEVDDFEVDDAGGGDAEGEGRARPLLLALGGFEGPIDVLLQLARDQKVDLIHISILQLAEQYLTFIAEARREHLELAADYLVMAAWLAYLKSRLLLPPEPGDEEPSGEEMAAALQFQLQRLEAMQAVGARLLERPRLGRDVFPRGMPEGVSVVAHTIWDVGLYDLLRAYGDFKRRQGASQLEIEPLSLYSVDDAIKRLSRLLGTMPDWQTLRRYLPADLDDPLLRRSAMCAHFIASLELAKQGKLELRQEGGHFSPIWLRARTDAPAPDADDEAESQP
ncbi:segregation and condensation protein A [Novispirillum sp. DQ9]|uniref:segregation and condensation protein A n=1 Tax=Novispirillum sp. DQ9 TaxID=3398612 RepID=UPI003C7E7358